MSGLTNCLILLRDLMMKVKVPKQVKTLCEECGKEGVVDLLYHGNYTGALRHCCCGVEYHFRQGVTTVVKDGAVLRVEKE